MQIFHHPKTNDMHGITQSVVVKDAEEWSPFSQSSFPVTYYEREGSPPQTKIFTYNADGTCSVDGQNYKKSIKDEGGGRVSIWLFQ